MTVQELMQQAAKLPYADKWRLMEYLMSNIKRDSTEQEQGDWHERLRATRGSLADEPLERPPQLPLEEREI